MPRSLPRAAACQEAPPPARRAASALPIAAALPRPAFQHAALPIAAALPRPASSTPPCQDPPPARLQHDRSTKPPCQTDHGLGAPACDLDHSLGSPPCDLERRPPCQALPLAADRPRKSLVLQNLRRRDQTMKMNFGDINNIGVDHFSQFTPTVEETQVDGETQFDGVDGAAVEEVGGNVEQISPVNPNGKRPPRPVQDKGKKTKTGTALIIQEAVTSIATSANSYASNKEGKFSIEQVMEEVVACGADYDSNENFIASELFVKKEQREMFMTLPNNAVKFN
ncbi:hypothetical protein PR202_ga17603 [Eleusine coracana subsp. coracana]|uniref:Uncharacterized protein n=1 Tax=Eleusine coracana subsp. coracana TaxID=191504 RepID=A0AAV5CP74_ELECO|nr:hypothetical protein PR202_ga17356 [Eleusine coracana subsp. coracana]GJN00421.1 hypothetical protein PR202_ga17603 [Eleusine coracana subsp. coracana]